MFGKNPIKQKEEGEGKTLRVVDGQSFYTIQGEGIFSGYPATFIRLHGCNLKCWFCDTEFSSEKDPVVPIEDLVKQCKDNGAGLVVLTGGEPLRQPIGPLIKALLEVGFKVQLETSGAIWRKELEEFDDYSGLFYIVSPKTGKVVQELQDRAHAYKYIINAGEVSAVDGLPIMSTQIKGKHKPLARPPQGKTVFLSPCDVYDDALNKINIELVRDLTLKHRTFVVQLQLHKLLGVE